MKKILIILIFVICITPVSAQDENYCHDKESWKGWDTLVQKYPHDMDIQMLHAVRIGFCKKIEDGTITFEVAKDTFNHLHETVFQRTKKAIEQRKKNEEL